MSANICNICGANLIYKDGKWVCPACGAFKTEEISNEEVTLLYNAAQKLRLASFDDAEDEYRDIIAKYPENSEAHWGLVLSKYGIKYEDDFDGKKLPTCYATSIESVLTDKDYLDAIRLCKDKFRKEYYIEQGKILEKIRVEWLEKASKEPKYDIFLCFKDSDQRNNMTRTDDSIEVANLYTHLSSLGYKVFYSRESLRDKVAEKYEPYIYNALNTAAMMIVYGSKIEYFSSVWMKNEWTRYVRRLREGLKIDGSLVIACDGVNPGDLPRPLNQMQVLDARKKTFYGDLEAHIAKIISIARRPKVTVERIEISSAIGKKKASIDNQIKTIKVGGGVGKKNPVVIDNTVSVREIGRYEVPALTPDENTKLKSVNLFLQNELFNNANKVADEILKKNKYNGQALLAKLLVEYSAKNIDELAEKINDINDFSIIHSVIEYNDKETGEKVIGIICCKIKNAISNEEYDKAVLYFKEIAGYNSNDVVAVREALRIKTTELLKTNPDEADQIFALLLSTYSDGDTYIAYLHGMVDDCLKLKNVDLAQKYNNKIIDLDDGDVNATFNAVYLSVSACNIKEFIGLIDLYGDFSKLDNAIRHFDAEEIVVCFNTLQQIFFGALKSGKDGKTLSEWFDFIVKYEFDGREVLIEKTLNELAGVKSLQSRAKLFDHVINCIDGANIDRHIELRLVLADKLRIGGEFPLAEKYYNEVIDIEEGNCNALWGILLCKLKANRESDISEKIDNFTYFSELEVILKYCSDEKTRVDYLDKLSAAVIMKSANLTDKTNIEILSKVFDGIIKYYPEEVNGSLINYIQKFADNCKNSSVFSLAEKYYAMALLLDSMRHEAYWGLLQAKLNCRNNDELIKLKKPISEYQEFSSAIAAAINDGRSADKYVSIAKSQIDYNELQNKKKLADKTKKKRITIFSLIIVGIIAAAIAFVNVLPYIKIESKMAFVQNGFGYTLVINKPLGKKNVEIPAYFNGKPVTVIVSGAFENDQTLTRLTLSSNITHIGNDAFKNCRNLKEIVFKNAEKYSVEENVGDNENSDLAIGADIYNFVSSSDAAINTYSNNNVVYIGDSAFYNCSSLEQIIVSSVTNIGKKAFEGCTNLENIVLSDELTELDDDIFSDCINLKSITLPAKIQTIGSNCFKNCKKLETFFIPASITKIGSEILMGCTNLKEIVFEDRNDNIVAFNKDWANGIPESTKIKGGFKVLLDFNGATKTNAEKSYYATIGEKYILPVPEKKGYKFIGWFDALQNGNRLTGENGVSINVCEKYECIKAYAIWEAKLNTVIFNANGGSGTMQNQQIATEATTKLYECKFTRSGYTFIGWSTSKNGNVQYSNGAYYTMQTNSENILYAVWQANTNTLRFDSNGGSGVMASKRIQTNASIYLPNCIFTRSGYTFIGWSTSKNGSVQYSNGAYYTMRTNSENILYAVWERNQATQGLRYTLNNDGQSYSCTGIGTATDKEIIIASIYNDLSVTAIGKNAFMGCTSLKSITIPNSVTSIGDYAFHGCSSITSITIPNSITTISNFAFSGCTSLTSITIPKSVISIRQGAFSECIGLESIVVSPNNKKYHSVNNCIIDTAAKTLIVGCKNSIIPNDNSVTSIGDSAFSGCTSLASITIPNSVTIIDFYAFSGCTSLTSITIPNSVTSIGMGVFSGCTSLTSITIPNSVTSIGEGAFSECIRLESIEVSPNNKKYHSVNNCIIDIATKTLIVGCKNSIIPNDNSVTSISDSAFSGCTSLTSITIPNSVTRIVGRAFSNCTSLTSITIPNSVTLIDDYAFNNCSSLNTIRYNGTIEQWESIKKSNDSFYSVKNCKIICTDGSLMVTNGNITISESQEGV